MYIDTEKKRKDQIYKQKKHLGRGSFGSVDKCFNKLDNKTYAVKTIYITGTYFAENIKIQAQAMKKARSDYAVQLLDHFQDEDLGSYILVMPYYRKGSLTNYLNQQWKVIDILCLLYQISQAFLAFSNQNKQSEGGCWHLDLKPDNILVKAQGQYLIADFGCAKIVDNINNSRLLQISQGRAGGTTDYAAPELINDYKGGRFSDIWSIGIILYLILYKKNPVVSSSMSIPAFMKRFVRRQIAIQYPSKPGYQQIIQICKLMLQPQKRLEWQQLRQMIYQCLGMSLKTDLIVNTQRFISFAQNVSKICLGLVYYLQKNQKTIERYNLKKDAQAAISSSKAYTSLLYRQVESAIENQNYDKTQLQKIAPTFFLFPQIQRNYSMQQKQRLLHLRMTVQKFCQKQFTENINVHFLNIKMNFDSDIRDLLNALRMANHDIDKKTIHPFSQWHKIQEICVFITRTGDKLSGLEYSNRDIIEDFANKIVNQ